MAYPPRRLALAVLAFVIAAAPAAAKEITIPSTANIFGAGHLEAPDPGGGGGGSLPPKLKFEAAEGRVMTVLATGTTFNGTGAPPSPPDGNAETKLVNVSGYGGIAGVSGVRQMSLLAVFLGPKEPGGLPPTQSDFSDDSFTDAHPARRQPFFVGDGLQGPGFGDPLMFKVPATATRVFFGFADAYGNGPGDPGYYDDNTGSFSATVEVSDPPPTEQESVANIVELKTTSGKGTPHADLIRSGRRQPLTLDSELKPGDTIRTGADTILAFEFAIGGRVGLKPASEVKITGERSTGAIARPGVTHEEGGIWVKCDKLKEPMEVQTSGGAAIKG